MIKFFGLHQCCQPRYFQDQHLEKICKSLASDKRNAFKERVVKLLNPNTPDLQNLYAKIFLEGCALNENGFSEAEIAQIKYYGQMFEKNLKRIEFEVKYAPQVTYYMEHIFTDQKYSKVLFIGDQKCGKSYLADCILNFQQGCKLRTEKNRYKFDQIELTQTTQRAPEFNNRARELNDEQQRLISDQQREKNYDPQAGQFFKDQTLHYFSINSNRQDEQGIPFKILILEMQIIRSEPFEKQVQSLFTHLKNLNITLECICFVASKQPKQLSKEQASMLTTLLTLMPKKHGSKQVPLLNLLTFSDMLSINQGAYYPKDLKEFFINYDVHDEQISRIQVRQGQMQQQMNDSYPKENIFQFQSTSIYSKEKGIINNIQFSETTKNIALLIQRLDFINKSQPEFFDKEYYKGMEKLAESRQKVKEKFKAFEKQVISFDEQYQQMVKLNQQISELEELKARNKDYDTQKRQVKKKEKIPPETNRFGILQKFKDIICGETYEQNFRESIFLNQEKRICVKCSRPPEEHEIVDYIYKEYDCEEIIIDQNKQTIFEKASREINLIQTNLRTVQKKLLTVGNDILDNLLDIDQSIKLIQQDSLLSYEKEFFDEIKKGLEFQQENHSKRMDKIKETNIYSYQS